MSEKMLGNKNGQKWPPAHSLALETLTAENVGSYRDITGFLNDRFGTSYTRNAVLGKAHRMELENGWQAMPVVRKKRPPRIRAAQPASRRPMLYCEEVGPSRGLTLQELNTDDCRFPYGDFPPFLYCGHPVIEGFSYCLGHYTLTHGLGTRSERLATS